MRDREWKDPACGTHHDRDLNAVIDLQRTATVPALPVVSLPGNDGTVGGRSPTVGKGTPVRYECGLHDASGQEKNRAQVCARS